MSGSRATWMARVGSEKSSRGVDAPTRLVKHPLQARLLAYFPYIALRVDGRARIRQLKPEEYRKRALARRPCITRADYGG